MALPPKLVALRKSRRVALQRRKFHRSLQVRFSRRRFLIQGAAGVVLGAGLLRRLSRASPAPTAAGGAPVRPPTADHDDVAFRNKCIQCGLCGTVCENGCIRFFAADETQHGAQTPYLDVRHRSCTLCMRCTQICPTDALQTVEDNLDAVVASVHMGTAQVERDLCLSYLGRICGFCHDACPLPGKAIKLTPPGLPVVLEDCVGCGRCVEFCPQQPTAISVVPAGRA